MAREPEITVRRGDRFFQVKPGENLPGEEVSIVHVPQREEAVADLSVEVNETLDGGLPLMEIPDENIE